MISTHKIVNATKLVMKTRFPLSYSRTIPNLRKLIPLRFISFIRTLSSRYNKFYASHPYNGAFLTAGCLALISEFVAQKVVENKYELDRRRYFAFVLFQSLYCGYACHFYFCVLYPKLFKRLLKKPVKFGLSCTIIDNFIQIPFLYLTTYYIWKNAFLDGEFSVKESMKEYKNEWKAVVFPAWLVWIPTQYVLFRYIKPNFRIGFMNGVNVLWMVLLSFISPIES